MSKEVFKQKMKHPPKKVGMVQCGLCSYWVGPNSPCDMTKNGYCQVSRFTAERDAKTYGMHTPRNQEEKT